MFAMFSTSSTISETHSYDFEKEENASKWKGVFVNSLRKLTAVQEHEMEQVQENESVPQKPQDNVTKPFKHSTGKRQLHENSSDPRVSEVFSVMQHIKQKIEERKDPIDIFSASVAAKLRQIKNEHKFLVDRDIDNLLYDALLGTGKYNTNNTPIPSSYLGSEHISPANGSPSPTCFCNSNLMVHTNDSNWMIDSHLQNVEDNLELTSGFWCIK